MKIEAYCLKCKAPREVVDPVVVTMKNGRCAAKGTCIQCGAGIYKILPKECKAEIAQEPAKS